MAYTTRSEIDAILGADTVAQALDRDRDGIEDENAFSTLQTIADDRVDAVFEGVCETPFSTPYPAYVKTAARAFMCALLVKTDEDLRKAADRAEERLIKIKKSGTLTYSAPTAGIADDELDFDADNVDGM